MFYSILSIAFIAFMTLVFWQVDAVFSRMYLCSLMINDRKEKVFQCLFLLVTHFASCLWFVWWTINVVFRHSVKTSPHFFCHLGWKDIKSCAATFVAAKHINCQSLRSPIKNKMTGMNFPWNFLFTSLCYEVLEIRRPIQFTKESGSLPISLLKAPFKLWSSSQFIVNRGHDKGHGWYDIA